MTIGTKRARETAVDSNPPQGKLTPPHAPQTDQRNVVALLRDMCWGKSFVLSGGGRQGCIRMAVHRRRRRGGTPPPLDPLPAPPPFLPMFEADSQIFALATSTPRGFKLKNFRPAFGGDHRGTQVGRGIPANPPPPSDPPSPPF